MEFSIQFSDNTGKLVLAIDEVDEKTILEDSEIEAFRPCKIFEVNLKREAKGTSTPFSAFSDLSGILFGFLDSNPNSIIYFYCDDFSPIPHSRHECKPQEYRSILFSKLFDKEVRKRGCCDFVNNRYVFKLERAEGDAILHIIFHRDMQPKADILQDAFDKLKK